MEYALEEIGVRIEEDELNSFIVFYLKKKFRLFRKIDILSELENNPEFYLSVRIHNDNLEHLWLCVRVSENHLFHIQNKEHRSSRLRFLSFIFPNIENSNTLDYLKYNDDDENDDDNNESGMIQLNNFDKLSTFKLFELLREEHNNNNNTKIDELTDTIDYSSLLKIELRPYQKKAVNWLISCEKNERNILNYEYLQLKYKSYEGNPDGELYLNIKTLTITNQRPNNYTLPKGGILADEMGLGKTIEILTLILLNRRGILAEEENDLINDMNSKLNKRKNINNDNIKEIFKDKNNISTEIPFKKRKLNNENLYCVCSMSSKSDLIQCKQCSKSQHKNCVLKYNKCEDDYKCPECWCSSENLIKSAATVIVSPHTIALQWLKEIDKHSKVKLKTCHYKGLSKSGWINPKDLSEFDVIVTDYNVLKKEVYFCNDKPRNLRTPKKYMRIKSPLLLVNWWRVCLDEAQMVENVTSLAAKMVKLLPAEQRWAITGTPIQKSIDDLKGLLDFIGAYPFFQNHTWNDLINFHIHYNDRMPLIKVLGNLMWRTCKVNVVNEINIPPQSEIVHYINMSDAEKLYYRDEHRLCSTIFEEKIRKYTVFLTSLSRLNAKIIKIILMPLLNLRQTCTVPMILQKSHENTIKKYLKPQELLDHLKAVNENDCKTQLRTMSCCYNGMASIHIIKNRYEKAFVNYQKVLNLAKTYNGPICVDNLLQIHALHNLIYVKNNFLPKNENDNLLDYQNECIRLEWKYLEPYYNNLKKVQENTDVIREQVQNIEQNKFIKPESYKDWLMNLLNGVNEFGLSDQLINKINSEVQTLGPKIADDFKTIHGIVYTLIMWQDKVFSYRKKILEDFAIINDFTNNIKPRNELSLNIEAKIKSFIKSVFDCHLSSIRSDKNSKIQKVQCDLCRTKEDLLNFECEIFNKVKDKDEDKAEGSWNPSIPETFIKIILSIAKQRSISLDDVRQGEDFLQLIEILKKEHKEHSKLWIEIEYTVKAYDELNMCKMRMEAVDVNESSKVNVREIHKIPLKEIDNVYLKNKNELLVAEQEFTTKLNRFKYICHLENKNDETVCPICNLDIEVEYSVLECGHHLCMTCLKSIRKFQGQKFFCAVCRNEQQYKDVYYVTRRTDGLQINGEFSSKIEEIVRSIIKLKQEDTNVKIIIFSQWAQILNIISLALSQNYITHTMNATPKNIRQFKDEKLGITCFLLPLNQGSKGLNLTEATHVFLVEPILNPGEELQAISRVHRIGQTKSTTIHRFIVKGTIEETIHKNILENKTKLYQKNYLNVDHIRRLFNSRFLAKNPTESIKEGISVIL